MATKEPMAEPMLSTADATTLPWAEVLKRWDEEGTHWLATVRPDGRPHVVPIGPVWLDGALYFTTGQGTRKEQNLASNAQCALSVAGRGFDLVVEGTAAKV